MDEHEVTVDAYAACVTAGACAAPKNDVGCNFRAADRRDHPVNCVTASQADQFCRFAGKRLPTNAEWDIAAGWRLVHDAGSPARAFPSSFDLRPEEACIGRGPSQRTCPAAATAEEWPHGLRGLTGNVREWTSSKACSKSPDCDDIFIARSGSWLSYSVEICIDTHDTRRGFDAADTVGFRCVRDL
jgi:formylglycine-generating enzyme required for sulfatase activity